MSRKPFVVKPSSYRPALNVVGTDVTVLAAKADTDGQEFTFQSGAEGTGPPPHSHDWDEAFFVVKGSINVVCGETRETCSTGTLVFVPAGTVHSFAYGPGGGEMIEITGVGSGASQVFTELDAAVPPGPPDVEKIVGVMKKNGVAVHI